MESKKMRVIMTDDFYAISELADKMDIELPSTSKVLKGKIVSKSEKEYGRQFVFELFKKMHNAKAEVNALISDLSGKDVSKMTAKEFKDCITELFESEDFQGFFG